MKSAAVFFLLSCLCPLVRADLLVTVDTLCQATPLGSSIPVYAESHSAVFPNGTTGVNFSCSTAYGSFTFGAFADQITNGLQMQAGVGLGNTPPNPLYALAGSMDLRASMPQQVLVALGGTGTAFLQGISDCGGDAGFTGVIEISSVYINYGSFETSCGHGGPTLIRYPIEFGQPFTMGWQGEIAFQLFASPGGTADGGFYLFDSLTPSTPFLVDQNGNPIPGAHLVAVPEPKTLFMVGACFALAAVRVLYRRQTAYKTRPTVQVRLCCRRGVLYALGF